MFGFIGNKKAAPPSSAAKTAAQDDEKSVEEESAEAELKYALDLVDTVVINPMRVARNSAQRVQRHASALRPAVVEADKK